MQVARSRGTEGIGPFLLRGGAAVKILQALLWMHGFREPVVRQFMSQAGLCCLVEHKCAGGGKLQADAG